MPKSILCREALTAATWWSQQLRGPTKRECLPNGEQDEATLFIGAQQGSVERNERAVIGEEHFVRFEQALARAINKKISRGVRKGTPDSVLLCLYVDYHPDEILFEAAQAAGIEACKALFPWKTTMHISVGKVEVILGYGSAWEEIPVR